MEYMVAVISKIVHAIRGRIVHDCHSYSNIEVPCSDLVIHEMQQLVLGLFMWRHINMVKVLLSISLVWRSWLMLH